MSDLTKRPKHHRNISIIDSFSNEAGQEPSLVSPLNLPFKVIPEDEISSLMTTIKTKNTKRELSQHESKLSIRKRLLKLYQQSKSIKPKLNLLKIPKTKKENIEKLFVPVLSSRRNNRSPFLSGQTQRSKRSDSSVRSGKSHTNSLNISPSSTRRMAYPEMSYLV
jgi:hypothetical protein